MAKLYQIRNWDELYENHKSRLIDDCSWCPIPNKQDGLGYGRILLDPDGQGAAMYGCFVAIVLLCSKQSRPRAGWLTDTGRRDGIPLNSIDLSITTKMQTGLIEVTLSKMCSQDIGWMRVIDTDALQAPSKCPPSAIGGATNEGMKEGKKEGKKEEDGEAPASPPLGRYADAVKLLKAGHTAFINVPDISIINELRNFPAERWEPAIKDLLRRYAGATILRPVVTLQNHLEGKRGHNGRVQSKREYEYANAGKKIRPI